MDFQPSPWLPPAMDENEDELLRLLYTRIGMVMEDASVTALMFGGPQSTFDPEMVAEVEAAAETIAALTRAAAELRE